MAQWLSLCLLARAQAEGVQPGMRPSGQSHRPLVAAATAAAVLRDAHSPEWMVTPSRRSSGWALAEMKT